MFVAAQGLQASLNVKRYVEEREWSVRLISACRQGQLRLRDGSWRSIPYSDDGVGVAFVARADINAWLKSMGLPFALGTAGDVDTPSVASKPVKRRAGRPSSLNAKRDLTRRIVAAMREAADWSEGRLLPWSAPSILDVCVRVEKAHCGAAHLFGSIEVSTFSMWLRAPWGSRELGCKRCFPSSALPSVTRKFTSEDFREVKLKETESR